LFPSWNEGFLLFWI